MSPEFIALVTITALYLANALGLLERLGIKNQSASTAAAELEISNRAVDRLTRDLNDSRARAASLEATRSLEPVLAQLAANAELEKQVLDRLVHHNGSFAHMEASMRELHDGLKLLTGFIASALDLPKTKGTA